MSEANVVAVDLSDSMPVDSVVREIMKVGGIEPSGWKITLAGPGHPKAVAWSNDAARKNLRRQSALEAQMANNRKIKPEEKELDDVRRENIGFVVSRIITWSPVKIGGKVWEFSDANAVELFMKPEMTWAYTQVLDWIGDDKVFIKGSATI